MKKILSLFVIVAMIFTMSITSFAATVSGMKMTITETATDITVTITVGDVTDFSGITGYLITNKVKYVTDSYTLGSQCEGWTVTPAQNADGIKMTVLTTDKSKYITTTEDFEVISYKVKKVDENATLSSSDFSYGEKLKVSKVTCTACGFYSAKNPSNTLAPEAFTIEYIGSAGEDWKDSVDNRYDASGDEDYKADTIKFPASTGDTAAAGDTTAITKKAVMFAKATENLTAQTYGIKVGEFFYPGIADVAKGQYWSIVLLTTDDEALTGSYTYKAMIKTNAVGAELTDSEGNVTTEVSTEKTLNVQ